MLKSKIPRAGKQTEPTPENLFYHLSLRLLPLCRELFGYFVTHSILLSVMQLGVTNYNMDVTALFNI